MTICACFRGGEVPRQRIERVCVRSDQSAKGGRITAIVQEVGRLVSRESGRAGGSVVRLAIAAQYPAQLLADGLCSLRLFLDEKTNFVVDLQTLHRPAFT